MFENTILIKIFVQGRRTLVHIKKGKRKGLVIDLAKRKAPKIPTPTAKPKYSKSPHPLMRLSRLALPVGVSPNLMEKAVEIFSTSVTSETQSNYATATRHYIAAEKALGSSFSHPPTDSEMVYLVAYLINEGLKAPTIRNYLAGIRYYLLSLGIPNPPKIPTLAEQMIAGLVKDTRNPLLQAVKKTRKAISIDMLKLLEHAIAINSGWSLYEKSLRWAVMLTAFWGSFRMGGLLAKK